jgi:hypothetical protein
MKDNSQSWPWHPKNLVRPQMLLNPMIALKTKEEDFQVEIDSLEVLGGVYLIVEYPTKWPQSGNSFNCSDRVNRQGCTFGVRIYFNKDELNATVADDLVKQISILDLDLPGLYFHADHLDHCKYLIKMQLVNILQEDAHYPGFFIDMMTKDAVSAWIVESGDTHIFKDYTYCSR